MVKVKREKKMTAKSALATLLFVVNPVPGVEGNYISAMQFNKACWDAMLALCETKKKGEVAT